MWPNNELLDLFGLELPIVQAPMASASGSALAAAVTGTGGLGSLPCAMLDADKIRAEIGVIRQQTSGPINVNFFCHTPPDPNAAVEENWKSRLGAYYAEYELDPDADRPTANRAPFDAVTCEVVEDLNPDVVSFHYGLPETDLLARVKAAGCKVMSSATTVAEAEWLEAQGCDAIIAQGYEAGGHRGIFLNEDVFAQAGTMALLPQVVDAVKVPVIAAGGIADGRGIAAAFVLGAAGVQMGTAYLLTPESLISDLHRDALRNVRDDQTALTNVFTGRPARGIVNRVIREVGPMAPEAPPFPMAAGAIAPLKAAAEAKGLGDFTSLWSGQAAALVQEKPAAALTKELAEAARACLDKMSR